MNQKLDCVYLPEIWLFIILLFSKLTSNIVDFISRIIDKAIFFGSKF